jgi:dihydroorotate dehydrogenase (fumarate)
MIARPDVHVQYMGLQLRSPLVASAGPITGNPSMWGALQDAGAGAIVLPSLFEEEIENDIFSATRPFEQGADAYAEALGYFPDLDAIAAGPNRYLDLVEDAVARLDIPVIASLNGTSPGGWVRYAKAIEESGAHAIELNIYDTVSDVTERSEVVERRLVELVEEIRGQVTVPLAVKLSPWFTSLGHLAASLAGVGVNGLVLFNRFYQPDIDLDTLDVTPALSLSTSVEARLSLHWIGALHGEVDVSLAASSGVHSGADALKLLLAGADVVMTTSALLRHGPAQLTTMLADIEAWMVEREYDSIRQLQGSVSRRHVPDPAAYDRRNYYQVIHSWAAR